MGRLVCKRLENVYREEALTTVQYLSPGLTAFYDRIWTQLNSGESSVVKRCVRLLKAMMLAYRPVNIGEVSIVAGLTDNESVIKTYIDRSDSFVKIRGLVVEFVHQSARDYLAETNGLSVLDSGDHGHKEIAMSCLSHLTGRLKVSLLGLPRPDSTRDTMENHRKSVLGNLDYTASFWFQHLNMAKDETVIQEALAEDSKVGTFLHVRFLEWLECF